MQHPAERLWSRHHPPLGYPTAVIGVPTPIPGVAFFPGGYGLWRPDIELPLPPFPVGGVMVLGHDFHSEDGYRASVVRTRESETQPTWRVLLTLLARADIDPATCFFTNVYMGLRAGHVTTGPFPGACNEPFVAHCVDFLGEQIAMQRPSLILTLGINVPPLISRLSPALADWSTGRGLKHLDRVGPVRTGVRIGGPEGALTNVVALTHPSMRHASVRHRSYGGRAGDAAELLMLREAIGFGVRRA